MDAEFGEKLYASDRASAKGHAEYPLTLEYIERLEAIAKAAYEVWKEPHFTSSLLDGALYDALYAIDFMDETQ